MGDIPSVRVGVIAILDSLAVQNKLEYTFKVSYIINEKDIAENDIVVCVRGCSCEDLDIVKTAKKYHRKIIYFLDDDLLNLPTNSTSFPYFNNPIIRRNMLQIIGIADYFWSTSPNIIDIYKKYNNKCLLMKAPALNIPLDLPVKIEKEKVKIVFAGSVDHADYIDKVLKDVFVNLLDRYKNNVEIFIIGCKPKLIKEIKDIHYIPYQDDYDKYKKLFYNMNFDIGLAPLIDTEFHRCKYYNKFIEYAVYGICGVYSKTPPFTFIIQDRINGVYTENNSKEWEQKIIQLIEDKQLREFIRINAFNQIKQEFTPQVIAQDLTKLIPEIITYKAPLVTIRKYRLGRNSIIKRVLNGFKIYGIKFLYIGSKKVIHKIIKYLMH